MKYSETPWKSTFNSNNERGVRNRGGFICFLPKTNHYQDQDQRYEDELKENEANALLISLAPDMAICLKSLCKHIRKSVKEFDSPFDGDDEIFEVVKTAETILSNFTIS